MAIKKITSAQLSSPLSTNTTGTASNVTGTVAIGNGGTGAGSAATARSNLGAAASGANTDISSISGSAATLTGDQTNWASYRSSTVANMLSWKNYGNGHVIFDASQSTSPTGSGINNTNAEIAWASTFPTLMGWNGVNSYGIRVDSARVADNISSYTINQNLGTGNSPTFANQPINVLNHGAAGDGTIGTPSVAGTLGTDDTAAFQAAIDAAGASGKALYIPAGRYHISGTLTSTNKNLYIYGDGINSTVLVFTGATSTLSYTGLGDNGNFDGDLRSYSGHFATTHFIIEKFSIAVVGGVEGNTRSVITATWNHTVKRFFNGTNFVYSAGTLAKTFIARDIEIYTAVAPGAANGTFGYFGYGITLAGAANCSLETIRIQGPRLGTRTGTALQLNGTQDPVFDSGAAWVYTGETYSGQPVYSANSTFMAEIYCKNLAVSYCGTGIQTAGHVEGINIHHCTFLEMLYGIVLSFPGSAFASSISGGMPGIYIINNHMTVRNGGIIVTGFCQMFMTDNLIYAFPGLAANQGWEGFNINANPPVYKVDLTSKICNNTIVNNSAGHTNIVGIQVNHSSNGADQGTESIDIINNSFVNMLNAQTYNSAGAGIGVNIGSGCTGVRILDNRYISVSLPVADGGSATIIRTL